MRSNKWDLTRRHINIEMYKSSVNKKYIYLYEDGKFTLIEDISKYKVECQYMDDDKTGSEHEISNRLDKHWDEYSHFVYEIPHKYPDDMCFSEAVTRACFVNLPNIKDIPLYVGRFIIKGCKGVGDLECFRDELTISKPYSDDTYFMFGMYQQWFNSIDDFYIKDEMKGEREEWKNKVVFSFDWDEICEKFKDNTFEYTVENKRDDYDLIYFEEVKSYRGFENTNIDNFLLTKSISIEDAELEFNDIQIGFKDLDGIVTNFMELR